MDSTPPDTTCPEFGGLERLDSCRLRWHRSNLELDGRHHAKRRVATLAVVEDFEVVERHLDEFDTALPAVPVEQLNLDAAPKVALRI